MVSYMALLLDTHAAVWLSQGTELSPNVQQRITAERNRDGVYLSAVTVWEVGNLVRRQRIALGITLADWVNSFFDLGGFQTIELSVEIVIGAANLPGSFHDDPADRFLVATARDLDIPILTRDTRILGYAKAGQLRAVGC
jgi:PIN domain nuclease of toxin-antitoxin system